MIYCDCDCAGCRYHGEDGEFASGPPEAQAVADVLIARHRQDWEWISENWDKLDVVVSLAMDALVESYE